MEHSIVLGVDIGGSHITAALIDLKKASPIQKSLTRSAVNSNGTVEEIISAWTMVMTSASSDSNSSGKIGIAMPGPFDYDEGISLMKGMCKYDALYKHDVKKLIAEKLSVSPCAIKFTNDAACFLQGEVMAGAAKGFNKAIGLTLGTGIGTSKYRNGQAEDADLWHTPFKDSIAEEYLSTRWFIRRCKEVAGVNIKGVKELTEAYYEEPWANQVFDEFGKNLATFLITFIISEEPEVVVLGGNIAKASKNFFPALQDSLQQNAIHTPICTAKLGEEAALIGAAGFCQIKKLNQPMYE